MRFASAKIVMVLLAGGAGLPAVATVFNRGSVHAAAVVTLGQATDGFSTGPSMTTMAGTIGSISSGSLTEGPYRASASHSVNATWASADAGTFDVQWVWDVMSGRSGLETNVNTNTGQADWIYSFTATENGTFSGNYRVTGAARLGCSQYMAATMRRLTPMAVTPTVKPAMGLFR